MPRAGAFGRFCIPCLLLVLAAIAANCCAPLRAQTPAVDPQFPASGAVPGVPAAPPAGPHLGGGALLSAISSAHAAHKARFFASPLGKMLMNLRKQLSFLTGGMVQGESPIAAKFQGAGGGPAPSPAMGAAQKIKADAKQAAQRREAVRYLGTVNCHYYPEAEQALIGALRCDRSECVRLEAALALAKGCCCTKKTVEALKIAVSGSQRDGNPGETSVRVRTAAFEALQNCLVNHNTLGMQQPPPASQQQRPEYPAPPLAPQPEGPAGGMPPAGVMPAPQQPGGVDGASSSPPFDYYGRINARPWSQIVSEGQQIVAHSNIRPQPSMPGYASGRRNIYSLWVRSATPEEGFAPWLRQEPTPVRDTVPAGNVAGNIAAGSATGRSVAGANFSQGSMAANRNAFSGSPPPAGGAFPGTAGYPSQAAAGQNRQPSSTYSPNFAPMRRTPPITQGDARPVDYQR